MGYWLQGDVSVGSTVPDEIGILARPSEPWIEVATSTSDLKPFESEWQTLASNAVEPNVFYEPWQLLPALELLDSEKQSVFLFVYLSGGPLRKQLIGFFPFERTSNFRGWPANILRAWHHPYAPASTPLLHRDYIREAWKAVLQWARRDDRGASLLEFPLLTAEGPSHTALIDVCKTQDFRAFEVEQSKRAALYPSPQGADAYLQAAISSGKRKELRRQKRRLSELGRVTTRILSPVDDAEPWIGDFLALEASGWKSKAHTSFLSDARTADYFRDICRHAHASGRLQMLALNLDDQPIAMKCNFLGGHGGFSFKIAYNEEYAKYSPGVLLELENVSEAHRCTGLQWMDSCAVAGHPMIDRLWSERRALRHVLLSSGRARANLTLKLFPLLRAIKRAYRPV